MRHLYQASSANLGGCRVKTLRTGQKWLLPHSSPELAYMLLPPLRIATLVTQRKFLFCGPEGSYETFQRNRAKVGVKNMCNSNLNVKFRTVVWPQTKNCVYELPKHPATPQHGIIVLGWVPIPYPNTTLLMLEWRKCALSILEREDFRQFWGYKSRLLVYMSYQSFQKHRDTGSFVLGWVPRPFSQHNLASVGVKKIHIFNPWTWRFSTVLGLQGKIADVYELSKFPETPQHGSFV